MSRPHRKLLFTLAGMLITALAISAASAHEGREVGEFVLTFGWRSEPALVGYPNGPEVFISLHDDDHAEGEAEHEENPLEDVEVALQVEVTFGPAVRTLDLRPAWGETGHYIADMIPSRPGDYSFHLTGHIGDAQVDETFASADGQFSSVEPASDITFPDEPPSIVELLDRIAQLEARVAALEGSS